MATKLGAVRAVQKPFQPRELLQAVQQSLRTTA
jgi:DNA-binding response OmpR family regulator